MAVRFEASTSAGVVTFETSPDPAFSGTWKSIGTVTWTAANQILTVSAAQDAYRYVRARIHHEHRRRQRERVDHGSRIRLRRLDRIAMMITLSKTKTIPA